MHALLSSPFFFSCSRVLYERERERERESRSVATRETRLETIKINTSNYRALLNFLPLLARRPSLAAALYTIPRARLFP